MAETVVSPLIDKLISILTQEAELLSGIDGEVADIKDELESIQSFLKDADARAAAEEDMSEGVKTWVKQLREVALRIDVFIDEYLLQMNVRRTDPRKDALYLEDGDVVGIESSRDELIGWLVEGSSYRSVVSLVGMGGLGKTTLAKKVYDHQLVKGHFDCYAWISASESFNVEDLLRNMIKQFRKARMDPLVAGIDAMDEDSLINELREYLRQKRAFQFDFEGHCPLALEKLSHYIVEKCEGLPLAIVAIGGLLSTKDKTIFEWQNLYDSLGFELGRNPHLAGVNKILSLSYEDLPYHLKSCFLYLGMYPEDYSINCVRLIRQWVAEGFVKEIKNKMLEEVGRGYLIELIHRSLVQVSEVNFDGEVRRCRLHDLFREIVLQKMEDLSFCHVLSREESSFEGTNSPLINRWNAPLDHIPEDVGSLFHLRVEFSLAVEKGVKIQKGIECLKYLQKLYHVELNHGGVDLIKELGKLRQLRKLGVKNLTKETMRALCASIGMMNHLESLDVSSISEDEIIDLQSISSPPQCLQRLQLKCCLEKLPEWIPQLQHLVRINIYWSKLSDDPLKAFQNLPNLLELSISRQAYIGEQLHFQKGGFPKLKILYLKHLNGLYSLMIDKGASPLLEKFVIGPCPQLKEVPSGIQHLRNLKDLRFQNMPKEFDESLDPEQGSCFWIVEHVPVIYRGKKIGTGYYGIEWIRIHRSKQINQNCL
uniref:NB-ARC domain-containing protein n=1 Tax=Fagus sylvatica TaxID=28930 RepID=A0A2N9G1T7_FAGSY